MPTKYNKNTIITNDIYLAAYLLSIGYKLTKLLNNNRHRISFLFSGEKIEDARRAYKNGHVSVDLRCFRSNIITIHEKMDLRQRSKECLQSHLAQPLQKTNYSKRVMGCTTSAAV